ncbi:hypothetical protein [Paraburkholderia fungorum]|uniref:hypothetical protein n=1 Tax=Paraburkholderia fungorum TaxID=134537 RepID=UPI003877EB9E
MDLSSDTRNQHFASQDEQRLNAANPEAANDRQRIFSFRVHEVEQDQRFKHPVNLLHRVDDFECLRGLNRNAIFQWDSRVFCSARDGIMVK